MDLEKAGYKKKVDDISIRHFLSSSREEPTTDIAVIDYTVSVTFEPCATALH